MDENKTIENRRMLANLTGKTEEEIGRSYGNMMTDEYSSNMIALGSQFVRMMSEMDILNAIEKGPEVAFMESQVMTGSIIALILKDFPTHIRMRILENYIKNCQIYDLFKR